MVAVCKEVNAIRAARNAAVESSKAKVEPEEAAQIAVAALIHSGEDARSLCEVLQRFAARFEEPQDTFDGSLDVVEELAILLGAWESHLPAGHRSGDAPFWSDVAAVCGDVSEELDELNSVEFGIARVLFGAIKNAALAHLDEARKRE